jgi:hypothetical protein
MSEPIGTRRREFGDGPLSHAAALIYTLVVVELLFGVSTLPGLVPLMLLDRDPSNIPLVAACAVPIGPAFAAALYALHHREHGLFDLRPAAAFWRGYRVNVVAVLTVWVPTLVWLTILAINLTYLDDAGLPAWWSGLLVVVAAAAALWGTNALVITSLYDFRAADVARLAVYFLGRTRGVTLGTAGLLIAAVGVTVALSEAVLALFGSVLAMVLLRVTRPMVDVVRAEFTT